MRYGTILKKTCLSIKNNISKKNRIKIAILSVLLTLFLFTGAALELDASLIREFDQYIEIDDLKLQMESMKDGAIGNELIRGIRRYGSIDYEIEFITSESNDYFVEKVATQLKENIKDFMKG